MVLTAPNSTIQHNSWPADSSALPLGDGRFASRKVCFNASTEIPALIHECIESGSAIYPQGGCTAINFGGSPAKPGVIADLSGLNNVIDYPAADMTITVEAGMSLAQLQSILAKNHQYLPIDPPNPDRATLGGIMATAWTGPRRQQAMRPRDQIIGIGFYNGQGHFVKGGGRVVKNVAGYDFPKLLTGSMGSLGIITELTFKVRPCPESTALAWVSVADSQTLTTLLDRLNLSATRPTAIEVLNRPSAETIGKPLNLDSAPFVVAIGFDDSSKTVAWQCDEIFKELKTDYKVHILKDGESSPLWQSLTETTALANTPFAARVITRPGQLAALLATVDSEKWSIQAHGGAGIATLAARLEMELEQTKSAIEQWSAMVTPLGGSITLPVCPTDWKLELPVWGLARPEWTVHAGVKKALDPLGLFNPGRFLGLSS